MSKYNQLQFEDELAVMLAEAKAKGQSRLRVVARDLHDRVVCGEDKRMLLTCNAMWYMWREQGWHKERCFDVPRCGQSTTLEIEFATE